MSNKDPIEAFKNAREVAIEPLKVGALHYSWPRQICDDIRQALKPYAEEGVEGIVITLELVLDITEKINRYWGPVVMRHSITGDVGINFPGFDFTPEEMRLCLLGAEIFERFKGIPMHEDNVTFPPGPVR